VPAGVPGEAAAQEASEREHGEDHQRPGAEELLDDGDHPEVAERTDAVERLGVDRVGADLLPVVDEQHRGDGLRREPVELVVRAELDDREEAEADRERQQGDERLQAPEVEPHQPHGPAGVVLGQQCAGDEESHEHQEQLDVQHADAGDAGVEQQDAEHHEAAQSHRGAEGGLGEGEAGAGDAAPGRSAGRVHGASSPRAPRGHDGRRHGLARFGRVARPGDAGGRTRRDHVSLSLGGLIAER